MKVDFINVGYGDAVLVEDIKNDFCMLIDGGTGVKSSYEEQSQRISVCDFVLGRNISKINIIVISHLHEDHVGGLLELIKNIQIDEIWCPYSLSEDLVGKTIEMHSGYGDNAIRLINSLNSFNEILQIAKSRNCSIRKIRGTFIKKYMSEDLLVDIFAPCDDDKEIIKIESFIDTLYNSNDLDYNTELLDYIDKNLNNTCLALLLHYNEKKLLLAADIYGQYWNNYINPEVSLKCDVLKLPHHGHLDGVTEAFIKATSPNHVVISTSNDREDGCPNPQLIECFNNYADLEKKSVHFVFTDAVNMPPYSTLEDRHSAISFDFSNEEILPEYISLT